MTPSRWHLASLAGLPVAAPLATLVPDWPTLAIGAGAVATAVAVVVVGGTSADYAVAGTVYCLALALLLSVPTFFDPAASVGSARVVLATLGVASGVLVGGRYLLAALLRRAYHWAVREGRRSTLGTVRTAAKALGTARTAVGLAGRLTRVGLLVLVALGAVALAGLAGLLLDGLGVAVGLPWLLVERVDLAHVLFVAAVVAAFHGLEAGRSTVVTAGEGVAVGRNAGSQLAGAARRYREDAGRED